jgi:branched-chain amino acid transport system ATP-binding protein
MSTGDALTVADLRVRYGSVQAVRGVGFTLPPGTSAALFGHNGAGKSSTLQAICGFVRGTGTVTVDGEDMSNRDVRTRIGRGISLVPEGWGVLRELSVHDNLALFGQTAPATGRARAWSIERIFELFGSLKARERTLAGSLSGGERQMLSIACSLVQGPRYLLLDEPTTGLSPMMVDLVWDAWSAMRGDGIAVLVVGQEVERILGLVDRVMVMQSGEIVLDRENDPDAAQACRELLGFASAA